jgi:hypothetical protein
MPNLGEICADLSPALIFLAHATQYLALNMSLMSDRKKQLE